MTAHGVGNAMIRSTLTSGELGAHNGVASDHQRCELYRGRDSRLATPAQRIVLHASASDSCAS
jgi:hypothetical protein